MITTGIAYLVITFFSIYFLQLVFQIAGVAPVTSLPLGMDSALVTGVEYFNAFVAIFPPLEVIWTGFLWYIGFRIALFVFIQFRIYKRG